MILVAQHLPNLYLECGQSKTEQPLETVCVVEPSVTQTFLVGFCLSDAEKILDAFV